MRPYKPSNFKDDGYQFFVSSPINDMETVRDVLLRQLDAARKEISGFDFTSCNGIDAGISITLIDCKVTKKRR